MEYFTGDWDIDSGIMYCFLEAVEFYSGTESSKMNERKSKKDSGRMKYGTTWRTFLRYNPETGEKEFLPRADENPNLGYTKVKCCNPVLEYVFKEFQSIYFPDFEYSSVQLTKNFQIVRHIDSKNIGESVLCAFGDYTGGDTIVEMEDGNLVLDARIKPCKFNGSKYYHYVTPFSGGNRYSLVFYKLPKEVSK